MIYHIYNRGAHKAPIFHDTDDYHRFLYLLYIANSTKSFVIQSFGGKNIFSIERAETTMDIHAYCLMPNHFHLLVNEKVPGSITAFMRKISTGYTMHYNLKYKHSGTIFQGRYKSKPVIDELYLHTVVQYIHLNPFGIEEPELSKDARSEHVERAIEISRKYIFSSFKDYLGEDRPQKAILERLNL